MQGRPRALRATRTARMSSDLPYSIPGAPAQLEQHVYAEVVPGYEAWGTALCAGTNFIVRADTLQARVAAQQPPAPCLAHVGRRRCTEEGRRSGREELSRHANLRFSAHRSHACSAQPRQ